MLFLTYFALLLFYFLKNAITFHTFFFKWNIVKRKKKICNSKEKKKQKKKTRKEKKKEERKN